MPRKPELRDFIKDLVANIGPGGFIESCTLAHNVKCAGLNPANINRYMRDLGFKIDRAGVATRWFREFMPLDYEAKPDENGHVPSVLERLQAQVANGERKEPAVSTEREEPAAMHVGTQAAIRADTGHIIDLNKEPSYPFESVITIRKLKGRFGNYTVFSDGNIAMEHCLNGTITTDEFLSLVEELCAVKSAANELEAMSK